MINHGADTVYSAAAFDMVERLAKDNIPVIWHVGLIPRFCTCTGGFTAVGKTAASARAIYGRVKRYEEVGAFGVEIEVVPEEMTAEISTRYVDLSKEFDRIREFRVKAFKEWIGEVQSGVWPDGPNMIHAPKDQIEKLLTTLPKE